MTEFADADRKIYQIIVSGRVQGVCFRYNVNSFVNNHLADCVGFVRNLMDGNVEIVISATPRELAALESFCRTKIVAAKISEFMISKPRSLTHDLGTSFKISR